MTPPCNVKRGPVASAVYLSALLAIGVLVGQTQDAAGAVKRKAASKPAAAAAPASQPAPVPLEVFTATRPSPAQAVENLKKISAQMEQLNTQPAASWPTASTPTTQSVAGTQPTSMPRGAKIRIATKPAAAANVAVVAAGAGANVVVLAGGPVAVRAIGPRTPRTPAVGKLMPLVNADADMAIYLNRVAGLIKEKNYPDAVKLLQDLIDKGEGFFENSTDGRRFISLRLKANQLLGQMGEEGLELYRATNDAPAERTYDEAVATGNMAQLQRVADRYLYTQFGPKALDALGSLHFDAGRFYQAAYCWKQLQQAQGPAATQPTAEAALLKAKIACAFYLAGEKQAADALAEEIKKDSPDAAATFSGKNQKLVEFLGKVAAMPVASTAGADENLGGWPGWGAINDGLALQDDSDVILSPRWRFPAAPPDADSSDILSSLIVSKESLSAINNMYNPYTGQPVTPTAELRNGQVVVRIPMMANPNMYASSRSPGVMRPGRPDEIPLPGMVHPVVVGETVIFRTATEVSARDLIDGEVKWSSNALPMMRTLGRTNPNYYGGGYNTKINPVDAGRYTLTVAEGKVFALANFRPAVNEMPMGMGGPNRKDDNLSDNSKLVAISVDSGKFLWDTTSRPGQDEILNNGKFLCAPSYANGRLFVMAVYLESYYLVCLNAQDGQLVWKQFLSQAPARNVNYGYNPSDRYQAGSPPAVVDGRVYALTNSGVLAAVDEQSGQPMWAYQYPGNQENNNPNMGDPSQQQLLGSANPILAVRGRLVMLPCDSSQVFAVSCEDGSPLWQADRLGQADMTAIDEGRILLSGDGLVVLSTQDGKKLFEDRGKAIAGRPAVTGKAVLASGQGMLHRLDLKDYSLSSIELTDADGLLGNLLSIGGKLIASNPSGLCVYFKYEQARQRISERLAAAPAERKCDVLIYRGQLAFNARHFDDALADFLDCQTLARDRQDEAMLVKVRPSLYRSYVACGNHAADPAARVALFEKAAACAATPAEKAQMKLRLAKALELAGKYAQAVAMAQDLAEQSGDVEVVDAPVGPMADDSVRFTAKDTPLPAGALAQNIIARLVETQGRSCYKAFDDAADAAYKAALTKGSAADLEAAADRWPRAQRAAACLFAAAQIVYKDAVAKPADSAAGQQESIRLLTKLLGQGAGTYSTSATVALASLYSRNNWRGYASMLLDAVRDLPPSTVVAFGDIEGKLGDLVKKIDTKGPSTAPSSTDFPVAVELPLREVFSMTGLSMILRDQDFRPIRIGQSIAMLQGTRVVLVDTAAADESSAVTWSGLVTADSSVLRGSSTPACSIIAALSADGGTLAIADRSNATGFDVASAKIRWQKRMSEMGLSGCYCMAAGQGVVLAMDSAGTVGCIDLTSGDVRWQAKIFTGGRQAFPVGVPQIGGGIAVYNYNQQRAMTCLNLANGKLLGKWEGGSVDGLVSPSGLLLTTIDGEVAAWDPSRMDKPLWSRRLNTEKSYKPVLLAVDKDRLAVLTNRGGAEVQVLSITGAGKTVATLAVAAVNGGRSIAIEGMFNGPDLYLTCAMNFAYSRRYDCSTAPPMVRDLCLQKFARNDAKPVWTRTLGDAAPQSQSAVLPICVGLKHIAVTVRSATKAGMLNKVQILDAASGKDLGQVDMGKSEGGATDAVAAPEVAARAKRGGAAAPAPAAVAGGVSGAPAVMTNGRLCVETSQGVSIYGK